MRTGTLQQLIKFVATARTLYPMLQGSTCSVKANTFFKFLTEYLSNTQLAVVKFSLNSMFLLINI